MGVHFLCLVLLTATASAHSVLDDWHLRDLIINREYVFPDGANARGIAMTENLQSVFKPGSIDEFFDPEVQYYLVDTIGESDQGYVLFVLKDDPNEVIGWLVIYNHQLQVEHQLEVFYENAEGNFYLTSVISNNQITVTGQNIVPEEEPISRFTIEGLRWKQIKDE